MNPAHPNDIKERLSYSALGLIAARAGCMLTDRPIDRASIDTTIEPINGGPIRIDVQLKASSGLTIVNNEVRFALPVNNYNALCDDEVGMPRILAILDLHDDDALWLGFDDDRIELRNQMYWLDLYGEPVSDNATSKTVYIPIGQTLTSDSLSEMIERAEANFAIGLGGVS